MNEAEEIGGVILPANQEPPLPLEQGEEAFNDPAPLVAAQPSTVLGFAPDTIGAMRRNQSISTLRFG